MQYLVQSAFLQSLGHAIVHSLWQMALVWLVYRLLDLLFSFSAEVKYRLAVAAQLTGFTWFVLTLCTSVLSVNTTRVVPFITGDYRYTGLFTQWLGSAQTLLPFLSIFYLLSVAYMMVRWVMGFRDTHSLLQTAAGKAPAEWRVFVKRIAAQLGIQKDIRLVLSEKIVTPLTIGFFKPLIVLPAASLNHLSVTQMEAVLLHELAHIKRHDYLVNLLMSVIGVFLCFNPFVYLINDSIRRERENSCDDWVLRFQYQASDYAGALLRIAQLQAIPSFAMAATGKKKELLFRIKRMMGEKQPTKNRSLQAGLCLLLACFCLTLSWFSQYDSNIIPSAGNDLVSPLQTQFVSLHEPVPAVPVHNNSAVVVTPAKKQKHFVQVATVAIKHTAPHVMAHVQDIVIREPQNLPLPVRSQSVNLKMDRVLANLENLDIEQLITAAFHSVDLSEEDRKEFTRSSNLFLSDRDRELLRRELREKQRTRLAHSVVMNGEELPVILHTTPMVIQVSFTAPDEEDAKQVARIKLALLQQLNLLLANRSKRIDQ